MASENLQDYNKRPNICVIMVPDGQEEKAETEKELKEIMTENLAKDPNLKIKETE